ncbi:MAG: hypothetical protein KJO36_06895, partial [Acidimicrobiia bacterium]|nr:hypothetical protein [Acidimicrobiia bacterium]
MRRISVGRNGERARRRTSSTGLAFYLIMALLAGLIGSVVVGGPSSQATSSCPLPDGGKIVFLTDQSLVGWSQGPNSFGPVSVNIDAGLYRVMAASYDPHSAKPDQVQTGEQWYFEGYKNHARTFRMPVTPDLPESQDVATYTVADRMELAATDALTAFHANTGTDEPNSVAPLCVGFYPIESAQPPVPTDAFCPLTSGIVVELTSAKLLADSSDRHSFGPIAVSIPAGTYDVTLASFDDHNNKPEQAQKQEQWRAVATANGSVLWESPPIADLPEGQNYLTQLVASSVVFGSDVTGVIAQHAHAGINRPESVAPICMSFVPLTTTNTPEPTTTIPNTTIPGTTIPDTTVPATPGTPEPTIPDTTVPDTTVPDTTVPDTTVPATPSTPETTTPTTTETPATTVPGTTSTPTTSPPTTSPPTTTTSTTTTTTTPTVPATSTPGTPVPRSD